MFSHKENWYKWRVSCEMQSQFPECNIVQDFQTSKLVLEWELKCFYEI
jgi:hypothetical protein